MYIYEQRMQPLSFTSSTLIKQRRLSENWNIQTATYSSSGFKEYESTGDLHKKSRRERKFEVSDEEK